jgi:hypothetical protein
MVSLILNLLTIDSINRQPKMTAVNWANQAINFIKKEDSLGIGKVKLWNAILAKTVSSNLLVCEIKIT